MTSTSAYMVAEWTRPEGYCDTGIRAETYGQAEAEAARMHWTNGSRSRYLPLSVARAIELRAIWGGGK